MARQRAVPKLFVNADPGAILTGAQREFCRKFPNQREVTVKGVHFIPGRFAPPNRRCARRLVSIALKS